MIFRFRMLSDENDHFVRDFEVGYDSSLLDLHRFLLGMLRYDECIASFFTADEQWTPGDEFTSLDMGEGEGVPRPMAETLLGQLIHRNRDRLIWMFDQFAGRAYYLELVGADRPAKGETYPRVLFEHGSVPDQYDPSVEQDDRSIFEEMMSDFGDYDQEGEAEDEM